MKTKVYILTGPVHTGKSTELVDWLKKKTGTVSAGLINPSRAKQKIFIDASNFAECAMDADDTEFDVIEVGKYRFSKKAFDWARNALKPTDCDIFIIDEIGKLEMKDEGLEPAISELIESIDNFKVDAIIIVVRDYLLDDVLKKYHLEEATVISKEKLNEI